MKIISSVLTLLLAQVSLAGVLSPEPGTQTIENVNIAKSAVVTVDGQSTKVDSLGAGLRKKQVAIKNVKVYVAQLLGSDASKFVRTSDGALNSLSNMSTVALQMTFVRDVTATQVQTSFADGFAANKVDVTRPEVKAFLDAVAAGGDALTGKTITIVGEVLTDGSEVVTYEGNSSNAVTVKGPAGFVKEVLSIWLGVSADSGLQALKTQIIGG